MDNHPDKYFSNKLSSYRKEPPSGAWDRIDANLGNAKPNYTWLKVAASVLILVVTVFVFFMLNTKPAEGNVKSSEIKSYAIDSILQPEIKQPLPIVEKRSQHTTTKTKDLVSAQKSHQQKPVQSEKLIEPPIISNSDIVDVHGQTDVVNSSEKISEPGLDVKIPSRVITYSAQEVNKKYLRIKEKEAVVYTQPVKEKTTITDIAVAIKNNHVGIGDLRQIKDDLFSLELFVQNDKTKTQ